MSEPTGGKPKRPPSWPLVLVLVLLSSAAIGVSAIIYTDHVDKRRRADDVKRSQQICGLITLFDDAYRNGQQQPSTELGRRIAAEMHQYREALHCP